MTNSSIKKLKSSKPKLEQEPEPEREQEREGVPEQEPEPEENPVREIRREKDLEVDLVLRKQEQVLKPVQIEEQSLGRLQGTADLV
jgi:hypothetical protein